MLAVHVARILAFGWLSLPVAGTPGGSGRHGRLLVAVQAAPRCMVALEADAAYAACRVWLRTNNTLTREGCSTPACLVFNSLLIRRLPGSSVEVYWRDEAGKPVAHRVVVKSATATDSN